jgi:branched-chain amino acid transport system permease protein
MLGGGARVISPDIASLALLAFPAVILGGLDSPAGAVVGGLILGVAEVMTATFAPVHAPWLGQNFHVVMPYLVLVVLLLVRPYGLFGTPAVRRV